MYVKRVVLESLRGFKRIDLKFDRPNETYQGWWVITGDNASGKTAYLKAIAMALIGPDAIRALQPSFQGWIRQGDRKSVVAIEIVAGERDRFAQGRRYEQPFWSELNLTGPEGPEIKLSVGNEYRGKGKGPTHGKYSVNPSASVRRVLCPRPRPRLAVGSVIGIPRRNGTVRRGYDVSGAGPSSSHPHARLCSGLRIHGRNRSTSAAARSKTWTGSCHGSSARSKDGRGDVTMRARRRTHHSHVALSRSDEEFQSQTPRPAWDAAWDRVRAERKQTGLPNTYRRSHGCTCYDWSYDQDVTQCATTDTLPRRAAGVTWR